MENQLKNDFKKIVKTSGFSKKDISIELLTGKTEYKQKSLHI